MVIELKLKPDAEKIYRELVDKINNEPFRKMEGGVVFETCGKCGEIIEETKGGVIFQYCPRCKKLYEPIKIAKGIFGKIYEKFRIR